MKTQDIQAILVSPKTRRVHCIGLGGIGVGGIAEWLVHLGFKVSGSDLHDGPRLDFYRELGVDVFIGHHQDNVRQADLIVYTSAAKEDHPERQAAQALGISQCSRGQILAALVNDKKNIIVTGSHGKTTTTAMTAYALQAAHVSMNYYLGGTIGQSMSTVSVDSKEALCVLEADESDASFLYLDNPDCMIITNIDADHLSTYDGCIKKLRDCFVSLLLRLPADGLGVLCVDDIGVQSILAQVTVPHVTYGFSKEADYQIVSYSGEGFESVIDVNTPEGDSLTLTVPMPGKHNALNALAAWLACRWAAPEALQEAGIVWPNFPGVARRFMSRGSFKINGADIPVIEDYGHHPREIEVTVAAARLAWPKKRVVMLFQPHRYTRTADLKQEFIDVLSELDALILMPVYSAGEASIPGIHSEALAKAIKSQSNKPLALMKENASLKALLHETLQEGDVLLLQGAGDVGALAIHALG